jgi:hypothetical protein
MQKIAGFCITDQKTTHFGKRVKNSFLYFHPDIDFLLETPKSISNTLNNFKWPVRDNGKPLNYNQARIHMVLEIKKQYKYDLVIMFDGDTVIVDRLEEIIEESKDFDVFGSLNVRSFHGDKYLNLGVTGFKNNSFLTLYAEALQKEEMYKNYKNEQIIFNLLCGTLERDKEISLQNPFSIKTIDKDKVYYNERSRKYWKDMVVKNNKLFCNNRIVKVLHWAGGGKNFQINKKTHPDFKPEVRDYLNKITQTKDF